MAAVDDRPRSAEQVARLPSDRSGALYSVSGSAAAVRSDHWGETGDHRRSYSSLDHGPRFNYHGKGGTQMTFGQRLARESAKLYEELKATPPLVLLFLSCLALLLVGAILVGASR